METKNVSDARIAAILTTWHNGPQRAIAMRDLYVRVTGQHLIPRRIYDQTRDLRETIQRLRARGVPIGTCRRGYFIARTSDELRSTIRTIHARALAHLRTERALARISIPELMGQYTLDLDDTNEVNGT